MKRWIACGLVAGMMAGCAATTEPTSPSAAGGPELAPATVTVTNLVSTLAFSQFVPCANGGLGEEVIVSGRLHETLHITLHPNGDALIKLHFQPQGAKATGVVTGDQYRANGVTQEIVTVKKGATSTFVNNFRLVGQGSVDNFTVHQNLHVTLNANGTITAEHNNEHADCK